MTVVGDGDNAAIPGARAVLTKGQATQVATAVSSADGGFTLESLTAGRYVLSVSADGYQTSTQRINVMGGAENTVSVSLLKNGGRAASAIKGDVVSTRELSLPSKAQEALAKGKEHLYQRHDPSGSLPFFQKVLTLAPEFYEAYYYQGIAYSAQGNTSGAESTLRKSVTESKSQYAEPCFALASLLTNEKRLPEAEEFAQEGLKILPEDWRGYYELARIMAALGQYQDAETNGIEARKRKTNFPGLYLVLANIHMKLREDEAVLDDINTYLKLDPDGPNSAQARAIKTQMEQALGHASPPQPSAQH